MKTAIVSLLLVIGMTGLAFADKVPNDSGSLETTFECPLDGYKGFFHVETVNVPDGDPGGVTIGPLLIDDDGRVIDDTVLDVEIDQTWMGDLRIHLYYDIDCDGQIGTLLLTSKRCGYPTTPEP